MDDPVRLTIVSNEAEAALACGLLRQEGIPCMHRITDLAFGAGGEMPSSGGGARELLVRPSDVSRSRELLTGIDADPDEIAGS